MMLDQETQQALFDLRWHWQEAYYITCSDGTWNASLFIDRDTVLTAGSPAELRTKMQNDYATRAMGSGATGARWAGYSST
jgi:hypothetical protein